MNCTEAGKLGGLARAKKLSKKRRLEISKLANKAKSLRRPKKAVKVSVVSADNETWHKDTCVGGEYGHTCSNKPPKKAV